MESTKQLAANTLLPAIGSAGLADSNASGFGESGEAARGLESSVDSANFAWTHAIQGQWRLNTDKGRLMIGSQFIHKNELLK